MCQVFSVNRNLVSVLTDLKLDVALKPFNPQSWLVLDLPCEVIKNTSCIFISGRISFMQHSQKLHLTVDYES